MYILPHTQINILYVRIPSIQPSFARPDLVARTTEDAGVEVEVDVAVALEVQVECLQWHINCNNNCNASCKLNNNCNNCKITGFQVNVACFVGWWLVSSDPMVPRSFSVGGGGGSWGFARALLHLQRSCWFADCLQTFFPDFDSDLFSLGSQGNRGRSRNPGTDLGRTCQGIQQMLKIQAFMAIFCRQPSWCSEFLI